MAKIAANDVPNYTAAQEDFIRNFAATGTNGRLTFADCEAIAANPIMDHPVTGPRKARSIVAKISRMDDVSYQPKEPTSKDGSPVTKKDDLVSAIASKADIAVSNLEGLNKAPKPALVALRDAFERLASNG